MITREDLKRFAPKAKPQYVDALMAGMEMLREAGILDSPLRIAHFMGQVGQETGGFTVIRESLTYTTAQRLREVWPARFRSKSNADLKHLLKSPNRLGDAVYGGRMGNVNPGDGFLFRGAGFLQTTGRSAFMKYATKLGLPTDDTSLDRYADDLSLLLKFACMEWKDSKCNQWADENDIVKVSKAINTGSATSDVRPVNLDDRKVWFAKAWSIWGERGTPDRFDETVPTNPTVAVASTAGGGLGLNLLAGDPVGMTSAAVALKGNTTQLMAGVDLTTWGVPALILLAAGGLIFYLRRTA